MRSPITIPKKIRRLIKTKTTKSSHRMGERPTKRAKKTNETTTKSKMLDQRANLNRNSIVLGIK